MLVSMRFSLEIRAIRKGVLDPKPLGGLPEMFRTFDIVMHPKFAENKWIYFGYAKPQSSSSRFDVHRTPFEGILRK